MKLPIFYCFSLIFTAAGIALIDTLSSPFLDLESYADTSRDSPFFTAELDPDLFSNDILTVSSSQDLNANIFADNSPDPTLFTDSNFFLASDIACDEGDIDNISFLSKKRRRGQCQAPGQKPKVGQVSGNSPVGDDFDFKSFIDNQLGTNTPFLKSSEQLCPSTVFGIGMSPVCEDPPRTVMVVQPNVLYSDLYDVYPLNAMQTGCLPTQKLWCCLQVVTSERPLDQRQPTTDETIATITEMPTENALIYNLIQNFKWDGKVCYPRDYILQLLNL